jgi:hypothetical protein
MYSKCICKLVTSFAAIYFSPLISGNLAQTDPFTSAYQFLHLPQPAATTTAAAWVPPEAVIFNGFSWGGHHTICSSSSSSCFDTSLLCCYVGGWDPSYCHSCIQYPQQQPEEHGHTKPEWACWLVSSSLPRLRLSQAWLKWFLIIPLEMVFSHKSRIFRAPKHHVVHMHTRNSGKCSHILNFNTTCRRVLSSILWQLYSGVRALESSHLEARPAPVAVWKFSWPAED